MSSADETEAYEKQQKRVDRWTEAIQYVRNSNDYTEKEKWILYNEWSDIYQKYLRAKYSK
tara:strand:- start:1899 stop:2078 length:180 start_codon:yes stop_codon:yes gene_type:complete